MYICWYINNLKFSYSFKITINMKTTIKIVIIALVFAFSGSAYAQKAQAYKDGTVWGVTLIKSTTNMGDQYLTSLQSTWNKVHAEAQKQGLIVSYKVLSGAAANPEDFDIMLLVEYKNLAAMEGQDDKWDAIFAKVVGTDADRDKLNAARVTMRTIYGDKLMREVVFNP